MNRLGVIATIAALVIAQLLVAQPEVEAAFQYQGPTTYKVRSGDTLSGIAARYGVTVQDLKRANGLSGTMIRVGQTLRIPAEGVRTASWQATSRAQSRSSSRPSSCSGAIHIVRAGETLSGIASLYGVSLAALRAANGLGGDIILPGQGLCIPKGGSPLPLVPFQPTVSPSKTRTPQSSRCGGTYWVKQGDSLARLASRFGTTVAAIQAANRMTSSSLRVGQLLRIPCGSSPTRPTIAFTPIVRATPTPTATPYPVRPPWIYPTATPSR